MLTGSLPAEHRTQFNADGFVVVDDILGLARIDHAVIGELHDSFDRLFRGEFETGVAPDEVNWQEGESDPTLTRQICNGWRADRTVAAIVLHERLAAAIGQLMGWSSVRLIQDNMLWKPAGAKTLGFHRDNAYLDWYRPAQMATCWIALDQTTTAGGTLEFARGSHRWPATGGVEVGFHAPLDHEASVRSAAAAAHADLDAVAVEVPPGGGSFHHGDTWHGSGPNTTGDHRRALVIHCAPGWVRFHRPGFGSGTGPIYSRYAHPDHDLMDESHFPVVMCEGGG